MAKSPSVAYIFVVVLVRRGFRYLLAQEGQGDNKGQWYLPAGRIEPGEDLVTAAVRETKREAGVDIEVTGIMAINHMPRLPGWDFSRWRFVVEGRMLGASPPPRTEPSEATLQAAFFMPKEIESLPLRGPDVVQLVAEHARDGAMAPVSIYRPGLG